jgi:CHAT domain-containing protein
MEDLERSIREELSAAGLFTGALSASEVGSALDDSHAAVSFLRRPALGWALARDEPAADLSDSLFAFLVLPGGRVQRIHLGATAELLALVQRWRDAIGRSVTTDASGRALESRGRSAGASAGADDLDASGEELRRRILDPILSRLGEVSAIHVIADDFLHLVPLDALPLGNGLVGDRCRIWNETSFARMVQPPSPSPAPPSMLILGGIDYDAAGDSSAERDSAWVPVYAQDRGSEEVFAPLAGTLLEARAVSALFAGVFEREALLLEGDRATKRAFSAAVGGMRFVHVGTHGWYAAEDVRSHGDLDPVDRGNRVAQLEQTVRGFAPMALSGLALAGVNRGRDERGRVAGILTAEELMGFALEDCDLAVLSACETNAGPSRSGQGIQSLQAALHAAGARTAVTSLWAVDDAATRRFMESFYTKLWKQNVGKAEALWQAKMELRAEGNPVRDWAGWLLSGDPD